MLIILHVYDDTYIFYGLVIDVTELMFVPFQILNKFWNILSSKDVPHSTTMHSL